MVNTRMNVARLNFSHRSYEDHARMVSLLRNVSERLETPVTLLSRSSRYQNFGGTIPDGQIPFNQEELLTLVLMDQYSNQANTASIDYLFWGRNNF